MYLFSVALSCISLLFRAILATQIVFADATAPYTAQVCVTAIESSICCIPLDISNRQRKFGWFRAHHVVFSGMDSLDAFAAVYSSRTCSGEIVAHQTGGEEWDTPIRSIGGAGSALVYDHSSQVQAGRQWPNYMVTSEGVRYDFLTRSVSGLLQYQSADGMTIYGREFDPIQMPAASNSSILDILSKGTPGNSSDSLA